MTDGNINAREAELRLPPLVVSIAVLLAVRGRLVVGGIPENVERRLVEAGLAARVIHGGEAALEATDEARRRVLGLRWTKALSLYDTGRGVLDGVLYRGWKITHRFAIEIPLDEARPKTETHPTVFREDLARLLAQAWPGEATAKTSPATTQEAWAELAAKSRAAAEAARSRRTPR